MVLNAEMILRGLLFRTRAEVSTTEDYPRRDDDYWHNKLKQEQDKMKPGRNRFRAMVADLSKPYEDRYPKRFLASDYVAKEWLMKFCFWGGRLR
jgi:hypothetical protein